MTPTKKVSSIRNDFIRAFTKGEFVTDKTGVQTIELLGASFVADEPSIFGEVSHDYVKRELDWYLSQSLYVNDIPPPVPKIWQAVASKEGQINSNYGYLIFSDENHKQYVHVRNELLANPNSRRAVMIYTRPSMHQDYNRGGMSDFICTNAVQYVIRDDTVHAIVQMRSNDAWAGYRNDFAWQKYVLEKLTSEVSVMSGNDYGVGSIIWQVGSLHLYSRQFYLIEHYLKTPHEHISTSESR
jgi:thymidylate synthase